MGRVQTYMYMQAKENTQRKIKCKTEQSSEITDRVQFNFFK